MYAGSCGQEAWEALGQYLGDYCRLYDGGGIEISLLSCVVMYFGYAVLLFLLGFSAAGGRHGIPSLLSIYIAPSASRNSSGVSIRSQNTPSARTTPHNTNHKK